MRGFININQFIFLAVVLSCWQLTACRQLPVSQTSSPPKVETREIVDDLNRRIVVPAKIERVVSLAPSVTENIFAVGAGDRLVGVTTYCNYPAETSKISKVGDTINPNLETIVALKPQIIIGSTDSQLQAFIENVKMQNIPVFVTDAKNYADVLRNLKQFGELMNTSDKAQKLIDDLQARVDAIESKVKREKPVRVFVQISPAPLFTIGKDSFMTDLVRRAGGDSATANLSTAYPQISQETALALQPEALVLTVDEAMGSNNGAPAEAFKDSPAVKNRRVYQINGDWLTRPGPRIVNGIEAMAKDLHPNAF